MRNKQAGDNRPKRSMLKRIIRPFLQLLGTDIGRSFGQMYEACQQECRVIENTPIMMRGMYRKSIIKKS